MALVGAYTYRGPWSAYAIEFSLRIHNDPDAVCDSSGCEANTNCNDEFPCEAEGATYEIILRDPSIDDELESQRIHLRFRPNFTLRNIHGGNWIYEIATGAGRVAGIPTITYDPNETEWYWHKEWFKIKITVDVSEGYDYVTNYGCVWNGQALTRGTRLFTETDSQNVDPLPYERLGNTGSGDWIQELGPLVPERAKGLQLQIRSDNYVHVCGENPPPDCDEGFLSWLDIGDVRVYPVTIQEAYHGKHPYCQKPDCTTCNFGDPPPCRFCDPTDPCYQCRYEVCEQCDAVPATPNNDACGTRTLEPGFGEECESPWPYGGGDCADAQECHCDKDCFWKCGDGFMQSDIDTNNNGIYDHCEEMDWPLELCGPGTEECDDGNADNTDDCLDTCVPASCGDGYVHAGVEECDDVNTDNTDGCLNSCMAASCGDGYIHAGVEQCDDGNADNTDDCPDTCLVAFCGDGYVHLGVEECDDGNAIEDDGCRSDCTYECGDGIAQSGGDVNDDGVLDHCQYMGLDPESCGPGTEQCDDGNDVDTDYCHNDCTYRCGDGVAQASSELWASGEYDHCGMSYLPPESCGPGTEQCDYDEGDDPNDCRTDCTFWCGDGIVQTDNNVDSYPHTYDHCTELGMHWWKCSAGTEECDDGNLNDGDGCASDCTIEN